MKKLILILLLALPLFAKSQIAAGTVFVGGDAAVGFFKNGSQYTTHFLLRPRVGYLLNSRNAVGIGVSYIGGGGSDPSVSNGYQLTYNIFHRYYVPINDRFYFALHTQMGYSYGKSSSEEIANIGSFSVSPKLLFFPSKHLGIELGIGSIQYSHEWFTRKDPGSQQPSPPFNSFSASAAQVNLGIAYYFFRSK